MRRPPRRKKTNRTVERLEPRYAPAVFGMPWPDPQNITVSFAPDGASVAESTSQLFRAMEEQSPGRDWELEVLRALQIWAVNANLNFGIVHDSGRPLGSTGAVAGDPRFGDIRIAATPMAPDVVGVATPFSVIAGTWAGDITLNSNLDFGQIDTEAVEGQYDLTTVMLHEIGHSLGLEHTDNPNSVMREDYVGVRTTPAWADLRALRKLYGVRPKDVYDSLAPNDAPKVATPLTLERSDDDGPMASVTGDITIKSDADYYRFQTPEWDDDVTIFVRTSGVSLLTAKVTVLDSQNNVIDSAVAEDPRSGDLVIRLEDLEPDASYVVRVGGNGTDVFNRGSYRLEVYEDDPSIEEMLEVRDLRDVDDGEEGSESQAGVLLPRNDDPASFAYGAYGEFDGLRSRSYRIQAPSLAEGQTMNAMSVTAWPAKTWGVRPKLLVRDDAGNPLPAEVLVNENGGYVVQLRDPTPGAEYTIEVIPTSKARNPELRKFYVSVDFDRPPVELDAFVSDDLTNEAPQQFHSLEVLQSQLFLWTLSADGSANAGIRVTVYDMEGNVVESLMAAAGETQSRTFWLAPGVYEVRIAGGAKNLDSFDSLSFQLAGMSLSGPLGPQLGDPTLTPKGAPKPPASRWLPPLVRSVLKLLDPYSRPWL